MVALVQRVKHASVDVNDKVVGEIGPGMLILLGVHEDDNEDTADWLAYKCANLRIFADEDDRMNYSLLKTGGDALVVPQFTLYGDVQNGHRPSFDEPAPPEKAMMLYRYFVSQLQETLGRPVPTGEFGAMMQVHLQNDGPVTFWVERGADE